MLTLYKILKFIFRYTIPVSWRYPVARGLARIVCRFNRVRRDTIIGNLTPIVGAEAARRMAPELLGNFCMTAVDFFCPRPYLLRSVKMLDSHNLEAAFKENRRVIVVTAHLGNWEIGISVLLEKGYPVAGIYAPYTDDAIVEWILNHRNAKAEWIPASSGAADLCVSALERGRVLGMVADIPFGEKGRAVMIAGHRARLPIGPWAIAARAKALVVPAFIIRQNPGSYLGIFHPPIRPSNGSLRSEIVRMQNLYRDHLEANLRTYPQQWGVLAPFWEKY